MRLHAKHHVLDAHYVLHLLCLLRVRPPPSTTASSPTRLLGTLFLRQRSASQSHRQEHEHAPHVCVCIWYIAFNKAFNNAALATATDMVNHTTGAVGL